MRRQLDKRHVAWLAGACWGTLLGLMSAEAWHPRGAAWVAVGIAIGVAGLLLDQVAGT